MPTPPKLILCVIDAMAPAMLERAAVEGRVPVLAELMRRGRYIPDCVAAFPSVTPVCAASIVTGVGQDRHHIPAMNWYHREEQRYVEYGSSFRSAQRFGITRQLTDTVYNMNGAHLSPHTPTVFETLDDADDVRTAGTTYLMYRGRHRHQPQRDSALTRLASTLMRHSVLGPRELFYADIFASRRTPCRSGLGMPGVRDRHSGCVGSYLVEHDLFDFMLLSLPDNDWYSHKQGLDGQVQSLARADEQLQRVANAAGGLDAFLDQHALIVMADHAQAPVDATIDLQGRLAELEVLAPGRTAAASGRAAQSAHIAVCPSQRAAMVYAISEHRRSTLRSSIIRRCLQIDGVELVMWMALDPQGVPLEGVIARPSVGELRFAPEGDVTDARGRHWSVEGTLDVLRASLHDGQLHAPDYPDALARVWSALICPTSGDVLLSALPGFEFLDWGRQAHVGGGSHGSLHAADSLGALILYGVEPVVRGPGSGGLASAVPDPEGLASAVPVPDPEGPASERPTSAQPSAASEPAQWAIRDVAELVNRHFIG